MRIALLRNGRNRSHRNRRHQIHFRYAHTFHRQCRNAEFAIYFMWRDYCFSFQLQPPLTQSPQPNQTNMQVANVKVNNNGQLPPARAILICHPNSHPFQVCAHSPIHHLQTLIIPIHRVFVFDFQTRNIQLEPRNEVKVGRSVPRSRVEESNAIFDCKVLSRNHAIIWFHDGKFFIKVSAHSKLKIELIR